MNHYRIKAVGVIKIMKHLSVILLVLFATAGCTEGNKSGNDVVPQDIQDTSQKMTVSGSAGPVEIQSYPSPAIVSFLRPGANTFLSSAPGVVRLARVKNTSKWEQGFYGNKREIQAAISFETAQATVKKNEFTVDLTGREKDLVVRLNIRPSEKPGIVILEFSAPNGWKGYNELDIMFACDSTAGYYGFGGQSNLANQRGQTIPVRVTEQGLGKDANLAESKVSMQGHLHDAYFPLPYTLVAKPEPDPDAFGLLLDTNRRSRFLVCDSKSNTLEIQAAITGPTVRLFLLTGPDPKAVVTQYTDLEGRQQLVPRWAFGPWIAIRGTPDDVAKKAVSILDNDIAATAIWDQDYNDYDNPDLPAMADAIHNMGMKVLTYFNTFLYKDTPLFNTAVEKGYVPLDNKSNPYVFQMVTEKATIADLTNPAAREWMLRRLKKAWSTGVDGWMADYGEWVADDMRFWDGRTGLDYANLYTIDWAKLNHDARVAAKKDNGLYFSRSGYLGNNKWLMVLWAGDQNTDFDMLDGLPSVIPYGTSIGLSGISAFGHDIAGYTGYVCKPSTRELYMRWTELGAFSPVMRTHRGLLYEKNWNWDKGQQTIDVFHKYSIFHLRMLPYLEALQKTAETTGVPAMRHCVLEFPAWKGCLTADHDFMLGPSLFVAPVYTAGALKRKVSLPPADWYNLWDGRKFSGPEIFDIDAPQDSIPVFLKAGGILSLLPGQVRTLNTAKAYPSRTAVEDVEDENMELWIGAGKGEFRMVDGTLISVIPTPKASNGVHFDQNDNEISACADTDDPLTTTCWTNILQGRAVITARPGPGTCTFGPDVIPGGLTVTIKNGPKDRTYFLKIFFR